MRNAACFRATGACSPRAPSRHRSSPLVGIADSIAGSMEPEETAEEREGLYALGFPRDQPVGQSELPEAFEDRLRGRPGGELRAGRRVLARARPRRADAVRTTISPRIQEAAVVGLAGRFGGIAALDPNNGEILRWPASRSRPPSRRAPRSRSSPPRPLSRRASSSRPPSSRSRATHSSTASSQECERRDLRGSFRESFAHSCNSVFAPLGVEVGPGRAVRDGRALRLERGGDHPRRGREHDAARESDHDPAQDRLDRDWPVPDARDSLQLASVSQVIAANGVRYPPTLAAGEGGDGTRVTTKKVANTIDSLMVDVVDDGTGRWPRSTGSRWRARRAPAELEDTRGPEAEATGSDPTTDAWFTAYAPAATRRSPSASCPCARGPAARRRRPRRGGARTGPVDEPGEPAPMSSSKVRCSSPSPSISSSSGRFSVFCQRQPEQQHRAARRPELAMLRLRMPTPSARARERGTRTRCPPGLLGLEPLPWLSTTLNSSTRPACLVAGRIEARRKIPYSVSPGVGSGPST